MDNKKQETIERVEPMKIDGNVPTNLIRRAYREGGETEALEIGHTVLIDASDEQVIKIADGRASIIGVSPNTKYVEHGVGYNDDCGCELCEVACNVVDG